MKKFLAMLLAVVICFSFTACGKEEKERSSRKSKDVSELASAIDKAIDSEKGIECPDFVGRKLEDITSNDEYSESFKFNLKWNTNTEYEYGVVYSQSETEGERLKKGAEITLYVSMGEKAKKVPDVYGMTEAEAVSTLKAAGFTCVIAEIASEDVEKSLVVKTDPQRTQIVTEGTEITVYVSR